METARYLACLQHDAARLRLVAEGHLDLKVPSCPEWTVGDLLRHVAQVYQHKTQCIRLQAFPRPWPPDFSGEEPIALLDRSLSELLAEFDKHQPGDAAPTWFDPDQSVGFWIRRMAQETVIHRVDGELAVDEFTAIPVDLAIDGVDEVLGIFLGWGSIDTIQREGRESWPLLADTDGAVIVVRADDEHAWSVRPTPDGVQVSAGATPEPAAALSGDPVDLLLWLWRRADIDRLTAEGDRDQLDRLHELMRVATQ
ncbi:MAG: maleylpyruvate isomerase family mycothiol-dependent enzyme [Micromonosporaceae bacterium]